MFFKDKLISIKENDKVLEIGPGALPHPRSDVFLELKYDTEKEAQAQRGNAEKIKLKKPVVYYDGGKFPFEDNEFDYIICSHVLEHVPDVEFFISELKRVAPKGYLEYPRIYYDYIYNYNCHLNFLLEKNNTIYWMKKEDLDFHRFYEVQKFFTDIKDKNHFIENEYILQNYFFEGFEWNMETLISQKASSIQELCIDYDKDKLPVKLDEREKYFEEFKKEALISIKRKPFKFFRNLMKGKFKI